MVFDQMSRLEIGAVSLTLIRKLVRQGDLATQTIIELLATQQVHTPDLTTFEKKLTQEEVPGKRKGEIRYQELARDVVINCVRRGGRSGLLFRSAKTFLSDTEWSKFTLGCLALADREPRAARERYLEL